MTATPWVAMVARRLATRSKTEGTYVRPIAVGVSVFAIATAPLSLKPEGC
jgi:hypothetical protein